MLLGGLSWDSAELEDLENTKDIDEQSLPKLQWLVLPEYCNLG
jgi:hypothetical protein